MFFIFRLGFWSVLKIELILICLTLGSNFFCLITSHASISGPAHFTAIMEHKTLFLLIFATQPIITFINYYSITLMIFIFKTNLALKMVITAVSTTPLLCCCCFVKSLLSFYLLELFNGLVIDEFRVIISTCCCLTLPISSKNFLMIAHLVIIIKVMILVMI